MYRSGDRDIFKMDRHSPASIRERPRQLGIRMKRRTGTLLLALCGSSLGLADRAVAQDRSLPLPANASKAAPSYLSVTNAIKDVVEPWDKTGATVPEAAPGWRAFFDALTAELGTYASAVDEQGRLVSLNRLSKMEQALISVAWEPSSIVRSALSNWLTPRVRIAWAERRLIDFVDGQKSVPGGNDNADPWVKFVGDDLGAALASYEGAKTVQERQTSLKALTGVLGTLQERNQAVAWPYSTELQAAVDSLYNLPNLDVSVDANAIMPFLSQNIVNSGPIYRGGYTSQVTAGPRTGFGLMSSDEGIAFYNKQLASTVTPISDFQQQLKQEKKGKLVAKLYQFGATSYDTPELTIMAIIRPSSGLSISPAYAHSISAAISAAPQAGKGLARGLLGILGLNQQKITNKVGEQAYPKIAEGVVEGANAEAAERIPGVEAQVNSKLAGVFVGNNTAEVKGFQVTDLSLRSRPTNATVSGKIGHRALPVSIGATMPQPTRMIIPASGVSIDLNLTSTLSNAIAGFLASDVAQGVDNVMIATKAIDPGAPPREGVTVGKNVDYPTFLKTADESRAANDPKVTALRIKRPSVAPEVAADDRGFLVILVKDFQLDVPAPPGGLLGGNVKVLRFKVPVAEFVLSFTVPPKESGKELILNAKVEDFVYGVTSKVQTVGDDEGQITTLGPFQGNIALAGFRNKLLQVPIHAPLSKLDIKGFDIGEVSPLDPSGWMRVVLVPNGEPVNLPMNPSDNQALTPVGDSPAPSVSEESVPAATLPTPETNLPAPTS